MKHAKTGMITLVFLLIMSLVLTACGSGSNTEISTFPNIDDAGIPDILEKTVGTLGNTYYSSGITDNGDYTSLLSVTFEKVTETDYAELMEHYGAESTGTDKNDALLFDWGRLQVLRDDDTVSINAFIR